MFILEAIQFYTAFCFQVVIHNKDISAFGGEIETKLSQGRQKISQVALFFKIVGMVKAWLLLPLAVQCTHPQLKKEWVQPSRQRRTPSCSGNKTVLTSSTRVLSFINGGLISDQKILTSLIPQWDLLPRDHYKTT